MCGAVLAIVGLLFLSRSPAQELKFDPPKQQQLGRYQIVMHPTFRGDQYLLDTITGQIWQLTKFGSLQGEPLAWMPMTKIDSDADVGSSVNGSRHTGSAVRRLDANDQQWLSFYADRLQRYPNCYDCFGLSR